MTEALEIEVSIEVGKDPRLGWFPTTGGDLLEAITVAGSSASGRARRAGGDTAGSAAG
jgi:hypothetical protein